MGVHENKAEGKIFEDLFLKQAQFSGLLILKNHLTARFIRKGKIQLIKSELDYKLIRREDGRVGYFDCKSFGKEHFKHSDLDSNQIERSVLYNECNVPSGFVVWFRKINKVVFFTGQQIAFKGAGNGFGHDEGLLIGRFENFDLKRVLEV